MTSDTAEGQILNALRTGATVDLSAANESDRHVDAAFLRDVYLNRSPDLKGVEVDPRGPVIIGAIVRDVIDLDMGLVVLPLRLHRCELNGIRANQARLGPVSLSGSLVSHLEFKDAAVAGDLNLNDDFRCSGPIRAIGVHVTGNLSMGGAVLTLSESRALQLDRAKVDGNIRLNDSFTSSGQVRIAGSTVGGQISMRTATMTYVGAGNEEDAAVILDGSTVAGDVLLDAMRSAGRVGVRGVRVGRTFSMRAATLTFSGVALDVDGVEIARGLQLDKLECTGQIRGLGAHVGGQVSFRGAQLTYASTNADNDWALAFDGAEIGGGMFLDEGFRTSGAISAPGARVIGKLSIADTHIDYAGPNAAMLLTDASVSGAVEAGDNFECGGYIDVNGVSIGLLDDVPETWPPNSMLDGFTYRIDLGGKDLDASTWSVDRRSRWLAGAHFAPAAYQQLASVYRSQGYPSAADEVIMQMRRRRRSSLSWWRRPWDWFYAASSGYGFRPARLLVPLGTLLLLAAVMLSFTGAQHRLVTKTGVDGYSYTANGRIIADVPTADPPPLPPRGHCGAGGVVCFNPVWFALDTLVPVVDLNQRSTWHVDTRQRLGGLLDATLTAGRLAGWFFSAVLVLITGRLSQARRE